MDEKLRAIRRQRRRERRLLRRLWNLAPVALVGFAYLLSAGVVKLMEVPAPATDAPPEHKASAPPAKLPRLLSAPDVRPELPEMLSTSILDHDISGPPEENRPAHEDEGPEALPELEELEPLDLELPDEPERIAPVPEPGSAVLLGTGLACLGLRRRRRRLEREAAAAYFSTASSSTSKVSTAPGGITPGTPVSP